MRLIGVKDDNAVGECAADLIQMDLQRRPNAHICLPTGASPETLYRELVLRKTDFSHATLTKLDEWHGLPMDHPATCERYLWDHFLSSISFPLDDYLSFDSAAPDLKTECQRVARAFATRGGIDLCILGLGMNGHLGLIEPADSLEPHAHVASLTEESRHHEMLSTLGNPPEFGLTLGIADLMQSRKILLLVSGARKARVFQQLMDGPVTTRFPASLLHLHPNCTAVVDAEARGFA